MRLFVAVYPPPELVRVWHEELRVRDLPDHRVTPEDQVHLTLQFVGDVPRREVDATKESVARSVAGVRRFELTVRRLISLPERGPARLIAVETDAPPPLLEIQVRLARRLARKPRHRPSDRFLPHLTVCRFRGPVAVDTLDEELRPGAFPVQQVRLMNSVLNSQGAQHTTLAEYGLDER